MLRGSKLSALTGLRFFAALAIFNVHVHYFVDLKPALTQASRSVEIISGAGVSLFFVLSGFILAYANKDALSGRGATSNFWKARVARIYPVYLLGLIWWAPFFLAHRFATETTVVATAKSIVALIPSLLLIQSWFHPRLATAWNGPGWTLSVEALFYLLFPVISRQLQGISQTSLLRLAGALWLLSVAMTSIVHHEFESWSYVDLFVGFNPLFHLPTFVIGVALGYHFLNSTDDDWWIKWLPLFAMSAIVMLSLLSHRLDAALVHNCLLVPAFAVLVYGLAREGVGSRFFALPAIVLLGEASYAFYILQFPQGESFRLVNESSSTFDLMSSDPGSGILMGWTGYIALLATTLIVSVVVFCCVERPTRDFLLGYWHTRDRRHPAGAEALEFNTPP